MFANIVSLHVKLVLQCFATLATQILEILVLGVKKQIILSNGITYDNKKYEELKTLISIE